jgi:uroporphyrinogen decarboxylase
VSNNLPIKPFLRVLAGECLAVPPIWLMRQAGRYLPEYREIRKKADSFLDLCFNPNLAVEITLQPVRRFAFDAAIIFSDILVLPHALGQFVKFDSGAGPQLDAISDAGAIARLRSDTDHVMLAPVYQAIGQAREQLPKEVTLLGFCGAPWTLATYMIAGCGTTDQSPARLFAYRFPQAFADLIDLLVKVAADHLVCQIEAGAEAVQIFDTWAGILPDDEFQKWCVDPSARIVAAVRKRLPGAKIIGFPRTAGTKLTKYLAAVPVDAVALDWTVAFDFARKYVQRLRPVQGNLDPLALVVGGDALDRATDAILEAFAGGPFIFNLGHGVLPETPLANVERLVARVRGSGSGHRGR